MSWSDKAGVGGGGGKGVSGRSMPHRLETGDSRVGMGVLLTPALEKNELDGSLEPSKRSSVSSYTQTYPGKNRDQTGGQGDGNRRS